MSDPIREHALLLLGKARELQRNRYLCCRLGERDGHKLAKCRGAGERKLRDGELHISADGQTLVFASRRPGGLGGYDMWISTRENNNWGEPANLGAPVNTTGDENRSYLSSDWLTLWYDGSSREGLPGPAVFRSQRQPDGSWSEPEEVVSQFAGEPNLSAEGQTLYFVHHYFSADLSSMLEADIYVSYGINP